ncbi:hypothetical protein ACFOOK_24685 [Micromonospora krabiensis]|uniref:Ribbon-helix-helix protein, copG family n=1 Tax=Micromonospora krabiensis TaxID=307121 RepID=A0A1C3N6M9_9ACTN|nr:hypothetical protein [Micromonospora krabiensis]SBV28239.1 hypothetical protein GA0070620_3775 [Micromonospora krabiensis]
MAEREETNVRLPVCAHNALAVIAARRGCSRDETVRQLLSDYVARQEQLSEPDRLSHIATVLRYPTPRRMKRDIRAGRSTATPLRLRLPPGIAVRARAMSLRLPGQSVRAHRDYQARLLTDAVMTAIAMEEPFDDDYLRGLPSTLRRHAAIGLWHLAVAATSTFPELAVLLAAEDVRNDLRAPGGRPDHAQQRLLRVAEALENDVAWHSDARFEVATAIARDLLIGPKAEANERMLYDQGMAWNELRLDLAITDEDGGGSDLRKQYSTGLTSYDWTGRGGTAVWRAERAVEVEDFEAWLTGAEVGTAATRVVRPPGWSVAVPDGWRAAVFHGPLPEPHASWAAVGKVLAVALGNRVAAWPLQAAADGVTPIPGIEPLLKAADGLRPDLVSGFAEAILIDWRTDPDAEHEEEADGPAQFRLLLPADDAMRFGLITEDERQRLLADARLATSVAMEQVIESIAEDESDLRAELQRARANVARFRRLARTTGVRFTVAPAMWPWPGGSVVGELATCSSGEVLHWLGVWALKARQRALESSMEQAWQQAFSRPRFTSTTHPDRGLADGLVTPTVIPLHSRSFEMDSDDDLPF